LTSGSSAGAALVPMITRLPLLIAEAGAGTTAAAPMARAQAASEARSFLMALPWSVEMKLSRASAQGA